MVLRVTDNQSINQSNKQTDCRDLDREEDELISARQVIGKMHKLFKACAEDVVAKANVVVKRMTIK